MPQKTATVRQCNQCLMIYANGARHACPNATPDPMERAAHKMLTTLQAIENSADFLILETVTQDKVRAAIATGERWLTDGR